MKIGPNPNFQVQLLRPHDVYHGDWIDPPENSHLFSDIYGLVLNHTFKLFLVPAFGRDDLSWRVLDTRPQDLGSVSDARAHTAMWANAVITPDATRAGEESVLPVLDVPDDETDLPGRTATLLYVSPEEYEQLDAELSGIQMAIDTEYDPETDDKFWFEDQFAQRHDAPTIDAIGHLKIAELITTRLLTSRVVDARMLRDPEGDHINHVRPEIKALYCRTNDNIEQWQPEPGEPINFALHLEIGLFGQTGSDHFIVEVVSPDFAVRHGPAVGRGKLLVDSENYSFGNLIVLINWAIQDSTRRSWADTGAALDRYFEWMSEGYSSEYHDKYGSLRNGFEYP